jgi:hypothetical protein
MGIQHKSGLIDSEGRTGITSIFKIVFRDCFRWPGFGKEKSIPCFFGLDE